MTKQEIGKILKEAREAKGMTQRQVAECLGRKQQIIGHWETGYAQPDANTLFVLCDLYELSIDKAFKNKSKEEQSDILYISTLSGNTTIDEYRRMLHEYIDSLTDEEVRSMVVTFKLSRSE